MKNKSLKILSAITIASVVLGTTGTRKARSSRIGSIKHEQVEHGALPATAITKPEADKKYPTKGGSYPPGTRDRTIRPELL